MKVNSSADPHHEKRKAYDAAVVLLAKQDDDSLRYAVLEIRRCIEAVVYEKLKVYGDLLPEGSVHQWQPPQAFEALIEIEPTAEESVTYAVGVQSEPGTPSTGPFRPIGTDTRPKGKWIKKTWHKLGFYLHADWPFAGDKSESSPRPFLEKTLADLQPFVNSSFSAIFSNNVEFSCSGCGEKVRVMEKALEKRGYATCLSCNLRYRAEKKDNGFSFFVDELPFACDCGEQAFIASSRIKIGYRFRCRMCKKTFQIVGADWKYAVADEVNPPSQNTQP
jgi:hypothetical protein